VKPIMAGGGVGALGSSLFTPNSPFIGGFKSSFFLHHYKL